MVRGCVSGEFPVIQERPPMVSEMLHHVHNQTTAILMWP
jgi:hypothetical protein